MYQDIEEAFKNITVEKELKPGGQKDVFVVRHEIYGICVLKLISLVKKDRVLREIDIVTKHRIERVPQIFENGYKKIKNIEYLYIFEEYIEGESLESKLQRQNKLTLLETYNLVETLLFIEIQLEEFKIVHRDIKPGNILIDKENKYYLIDFGIARALDMKSLTFTEAIMGPHSVGYGAPELFEYKKSDIDCRADLFSIGVVAYECITGKHPFINYSDNAEMIRYKTRTLIPEDVIIQGDSQQQFMGLLQTLMKKQITRRPPSAKKAYEWLKALKETLYFGGE